MLSQASKRLLLEIIGYAKDEAAKQLKDMNNGDAYQHMQKSGVYLQLQIRNHNEHGGRWLGQSSDAPGVTWATCEGEYKFWDENEQKEFMKIDGMPTAARALVFAMMGRHEFHKTHSVSMGFTGIIDEAFGPPSPQRISLRDILKPLHFWEEATTDDFTSDTDSEDSDTESSADFFKQFWSLADEVIRNAPHMLRPGYESIRRNRRVDCFSWARLLILLFLPERVFMQKLKEAGLVQNPPVGWYREAREAIKGAILKSKRAAKRNAIQYGWDKLCKELDQLYTETFSPEQIVEDATKGDRGESSSQSGDEATAGDHSNSALNFAKPQSRKRKIVKDSEDDETDSPDETSVPDPPSRLRAKRPRRKVVKDSEDEASTLSEPSTESSSPAPSPSTLEP